ncbi:MAG TPA: hypothetical protein DCQ92_16500 [Verrucomicrobia subdivision 3 bacterium]|nr:hypothetical protein [Limisphaerales bacterium]
MHRHSSLDDGKANSLVFTFPKALNKDEDFAAPEPDFFKWLDKALFLDVAISGDEAEDSSLTGPERDPVSAMKDSAMGNSILANWLSDVRKGMEQDGELTEAAIKIPFHGKPNKLSLDLAELRLRLSQNSDGADAAARREENKKQALAYIDRELRMLEWGKEDCKQREMAEEEAQQAAAVLPSLAVLDKIMRYETKLERLQRMRQGEAVPPPLTLEVSERP